MANGVELVKGVWGEKQSEEERQNCIKVLDIVDSNYIRVVISVENYCKAFGKFPPMLYKGYVDFIWSEIVAGEHNGGYYWKKPDADYYLGSGYKSKFGTSEFSDGITIKGVSDTYDNALYSATGASKVEQKEKEKGFIIKLEDFEKVDFNSANPEHGRISWNITQEKVNDLNRCLVDYGMATFKYACHFIAQCTAEGAIYLTEAEFVGYTARFNYFVSEEYGIKNGNKSNGDGYRYRGSGYIQLTGRDNYEAFSKHMNDSKISDDGLNGEEDTSDNKELKGEDCAQYVADKYPWEAGCYWWQMNKINDLIDGWSSEGISDLDIVENVTQKVRNGGGYTITDRQKAYELFSKALLDRMGQ